VKNTLQGDAEKLLRAALHDKVQRNIRTTAMDLKGENVSVTAARKYSKAKMRAYKPGVLKCCEERVASACGKGNTCCF
jgi:hypothetical protein